jgi:uncharacterized protein involved in type VI secretion and phage assembly
MATLQGVYSASVLDNRDREGLARVLVRVSGVTETGTTDLWARVATLMAGKNRGTFFVPEAGDEVLVAFERGDIKVPYVIGALWNAKASPPATAADAAAGLKLIRSRNGITVRIRDDNNSLTLETPGGQRITLQDGAHSVRIEDANGNSATMSSSGVTVNASTSVTVNAGATVTVNAGATMTLTAASVEVNAAMARFNGMVQCTTLTTNAVISGSYTPGTGNIW